MLLKQVVKASPAGNKLPASKNNRAFYWTAAARLQLICCLVVLWVQTVSIAPVSGQTRVQSPKSTTGPGQAAASKTSLHGHINAFGMACVSAGVIPLSTELPTTVEKVNKGSRAFYAGVVAGDRILQASIDKNQLNLKIERNGKIYLAKMQAQTDDVPPAKLGGGADQGKLASILRSYEIRLIVDHSGSMYRSLGNSDKLRWTWVKEELDRFCRNAQRQAGSVFDLYLFNETVESTANQSAQQIRNTLDNTVTTGNTDLPAALRVATADAARPLLIILVTDGQAVSSKENGAILVENLSRTPILRRSRVVFLQTGYSSEGSSFIASLNDAMAAHGMGKHSYVVLYEEASQKGILGAIEPLLTQ